MTYFAHMHVEPLPELFVFICIIDQGIGSVEDDVYALPVGKAFKKRSEFDCSCFEITVLREIQAQSTKGVWEWDERGMPVFAVPNDVTVSSILFGIGSEPLDRLLIIVFLAFDDDLQLKNQ
jgi:hypothetical protein